MDNSQANPSPNPQIKGDRPTEPMWANWNKIKARDADQALRVASKEIRPFLEAD
jgi:hypothetical protein